MNAQIDVSQLPKDVQVALLSGKAKLTVTKQRVWCDCNLGLTGEALQEHLNAGCPTKRLGEAESAEVSLA